jgi:hypothetical protein
MTTAVVEAIGALSKRIQEIEASRVLESRSERSRLSPESEPIQEAIDRVLFCTFGLSEAEGQYISKRLTEML